MPRLYDYLPSQNGYKVRLLLAHLGLECERRMVEIFQGGSRTARFLEMNRSPRSPSGSTHGL